MLITMVQVSASYDPPRLRCNIISTLSVILLTMHNFLYCIVQNTPDHLELVRVPKLSSVLLFIACTNIAHMLLESVRISVYYFIETQLNVTITVYYTHYHASITEMGSN